MYRFFVAVLCLAAACTPAKRTEVVCTMEVKACPDGSHVGRDPANNCAFRPCP
jgi:hypothetical protein